MKHKNIKLSGVVISKNEESRISTCLESLAFCDEIIIVDNGSTDATLDIAKKFNVRIKQSNQIDFSKLRNEGKDMADGKWILYVDADEIVPLELQNEILSIVDKEIDVLNSPIAYYISRLNYYLGRQWPVRDKMQRLFLKSKLERWEGIVHESAIVNGKTSDCKQSFIHHTHRNLEEMVAKTNSWSDIEAKLRLTNNHPDVVWWRFLRVMGTGFMKSFINESGWKAKTEGWIESIYQAFSMFITYAKLWEMQHVRSMKYEV